MPQYIDPPVPTTLREVAERLLELYVTAERQVLSERAEYGGREWLDAEVAAWHDLIAQLDTGARREHPPASRPLLFTVRYWLGGQGQSAGWYWHFAPVAPRPPGLPGILCGPYPTEAEAQTAGERALRA